MKGIVLCSGGLDSTLAYLKLVDKGYEAIPMYVKHKHWAEAGELECLERMFPRLVTINVNLGAQVDGVWGRTIAFVGLAAMWAFTHGNDYDFIAIGNHIGDVSPDLTPGDFDRQLNSVLRIATKDRISLTCPIRDYDIARIGCELFVDYEVRPEDVYSCYWAPSCGYKHEKDTYRCAGCRRKKLAMMAAGITDEKLLDLPNCSERNYYPENATKSDY